MDVRPIRPDEVEAYRDVRLRALREAPYAFSTTFDEAAARPESTWREFTHRLAAREELVGFVLDRGDGRLAGLATVRLEALSAEVNQMWLDEDLRGQGHAEALLHAAEAFAQERGVVCMELWVEDDNHRAIRTYERCGYQ
ncbi:MAG: GNAT family N-acetyltransferase, partial [Chloroflexi bacterium]|nr:GNAT family N-acetyltransferase [Chloroflexota bacterium]